jgi:hypothetical protein
LLLSASRDRIAKVDLRGTQAVAGVSRAVRTCPQSGEGDQRVLPRLSEVVLLPSTGRSGVLARGCEYDEVVSVGEPSLSAAGVTFLAHVARGAGAGVTSEIRTWRSGATAVAAWHESDAGLVSLARDRELLAVRNRAADAAYVFDLIRLRR